MQIAIEINGCENTLLRLPLVDNIERYISRDYLRVVTICDDGNIRLSTNEEIDSVDERIAYARQSQKQSALKLVEVKFLDLCNQVLGERRKAGFEELRNHIEDMAKDQSMIVNALAITARLSAINDEGVREGGLRWWDDIYDHGEVVI
jgi:hypothetical protein